MEKETRDLWSQRLMGEKNHVSWWKRLFFKIFKFPHKWRPWFSHVPLIDSKDLEAKSLDLSDMEKHPFILPHIKTHDET